MMKTRFWMQNSFTVDGRGLRQDRYSGHNGWGTRLAPHHPLHPPDPTRKKKFDILTTTTPIDVVFGAK